MTVRRRTPGAWHHVYVGSVAWRDGARPAQLSDEVLAFLAEYHLATLTTLREDLSPHVVAVGFSYDAEQRVARVITWAGSQKARNAERMQTAGQRAAVCQVDGGRWLSLEGPVRLVTDRRRRQGRGRRLRGPVSRSRRNATTGS